MVAAAADEMFDALSAIALLSTLDAATLRTGLERCQLVPCPAGGTVIEQGEYEDCFYVLVEGRCDVWVKRESRSKETVEDLVGGPPSLRGDEHLGQTERVAQLGSGDFFGELACMSPWPRASSVRAVTEALVLEIDAHVFEEWMESSEAFRAIMDESYMSRGVMALLRRISAFSELDDGLLESLHAGATLRSHERGDVIVREGDEGEAFFIIRGGSVVVTKRAGSEQRTVSYLSSGKYFGEMALLEGTPRTATVSAATPTELVCIGRDSFTDMVARSPTARASLERAVKRRAHGTEVVMGSESIAQALAFVAEQGVLGAVDDMLVVDLDRCIYCGSCEAACRSTYGTSRILLDGPSHGGLMFPTACRNCTDPRCTLRCPVEAIGRDARGEVRIESHCIGCGQCAVHCPYGTISLAPQKGVAAEDARGRAGLTAAVTRQAVKCDLCEARGGGPQCVLACPTAALVSMGSQALLRRIFGDR